MDHIAAFDTLYTNNHIQILKLLLPCLPKDKQYFGAIFIKYLELQYVIHYGKQLAQGSCYNSDQKPDYAKLCHDILPYCTEKEAHIVNSIQNMLQTFETFKSMQSMLELFAPSDVEGDNAGSGFDFSSLMNMGNLFSGGMDLDGLQNIMSAFTGQDMDIGSEIFDQFRDSFTNDTNTDNENKEESCNL